MKTRMVFGYKTICNKIAVKIIEDNLFPKILPQIGRRDIGLYILINYLSPFLKIGVALASYPMPWYGEVVLIIFNVTVKFDSK